MSTSESDSETSPLLPSQSPPRRVDDVQTWSEVAPWVLPLLVLNVPTIVLLIIVSLGDQRELEQQFPDVFAGFSVRRSNVLNKSSSNFPIKVLFSVLVNLGQLRVRFRHEECWISPILHFSAALFMLLASAALYIFEVLLHFSEHFWFDNRIVCVIALCLLDT
jgi:hypothetical protein